MKVYCHIVKYTIDKRKKETIFGIYDSGTPTHFKFVLSEGNGGSFLLCSDLKEIGHKSTIHNFTFARTSWGWSLSGDLFIYNKEIDI